MENGGSDNSSEEDIIRMMRNSALSEEELRRVKKEAESRMEGANYSSFKSEAQACADEAQRNRHKY